MGRPPHRNTGNVTKVESAINKDRGHMVHYLAEITGLGKLMVHRILKSDLKISKAPARWVPRLLSGDDCGHNPASYNCKLSDVMKYLNDMGRWVRPIAGKISAKTSLFEIFPS